MEKTKQRQKKVTDEQHAEGYYVTDRYVSKMIVIIVLTLLVIAVILIWYHHDGFLNG